MRTLGSGDCGEEGITEGPRDWNSEGREVEGAGGKEGGERQDHTRIRKETWW